MPSHFSAARGAYVMRPSARRTEGRHGVRARHDEHREPGEAPARAGPERLNVKVVAAISPQLFAARDAAYRNATVSDADRIDAMVITNGAYKLMRDWADDPIVHEYSLSSDWDDRWRTGGSIEEVMEEAHLDGAHIFEAIERFAASAREAAPASRTTGGRRRALGRPPRAGPLLA